MMIEIKNSQYFEKRIKNKPLDKVRRLYQIWRNRTKESKIYIAMLFALSGGKCPQCGVDMWLSFTKAVNDRKATLDHVIPLSEMMEHKKYNLQILCKKCNTLKADSLSVD